MARILIVAAILLALPAAVSADGDERIFQKKDGSITTVQSTRNPDGTYQSHQVTHYASRQDFEANRSTKLAEMAMAVLVNLFTQYVESGRAIEDYRDITAAIRNKAAAVSRRTGKTYARLSEAVQGSRHKSAPTSPGRMEANRAEGQAWEQFDLVDRGKGKVALKFHTGFLCAEYGGGGTVVADRPEAGDWETWELIDHGDGTISLRASDGHFLRAAEGGGHGLAADREKAGPWEKFVLERRGGTACLKVNKGQFVSAQP